MAKGALTGDNGVRDRPRPLLSRRPPVRAGPGGDGGARRPPELGQGRGSRARACGIAQVAAEEVAGNVVERAGG